VAHLLEWLTETAIHIVDTMGVWGIFVGMVIESACIPLPSEVIMLTGGVLVARGSLSFLEVALAGVLGNVAGSLIAYAAGAAGGRNLLLKVGKYILFKVHHLEQAERWFARYGESAVLLARNLPFIRTFISLPAGIARMNPGKFIVFSFLGCLPWNFALTYLGYRLGDNWNVVERYLHPVSYALAAGVLLMVLIWFIRRWRQTRPLEEKTPE